MPGTIQSELSFSAHAIEQAAKRNFSVEEIYYALQHGQRIYRTGIVFYFLGCRNIPKADRRDSHITRLVGTTLLVSHNRELITVYRNPDGLRDIKRKLKHRIDRRDLVA